MTNSLITKDWLYKLSNYDTLFVGFSGGLDSTVLMHCLATQPMLVGKLRAIHVHHGVSVNAAAWQAHCLQTCETLSIPLTVFQVEFDRRANIEENARIARYDAFSSLLSCNDCLLLAHHCDDQAETLLLQLFRGAGVDGMAAMSAHKALAKGALARPFLQHLRQTLESYALEHQLTWVDDESNQDSAFSRNYLRHHIMPLLQEKWPGVVNNLVRSASHCQEAKLNLEALAEIDCVGLGAQEDMLVVPILQTLSRTRLVNVLRVFLKKNQVRLPSDKILNRLIDELILARADATPIIQWGGMSIRRYQQTLYVFKHKIKPPPASIEWSAFPAPLALDESQYLQAFPDVAGMLVPVGSRVQVRFRQGGELFFWHGQTKSLKKLLQQWLVPPWQRDLVPLLYIDNEIAAVVGFAISDHYYGIGQQDTYLIELCSS